MTNRKTNGSPCRLNHHARNRTLKPMPDVRYRFKLRSSDRCRSAYPRRFNGKNRKERQHQNVQVTENNGTRI